MSKIDLVSIEFDKMRSSILSLLNDKIDDSLLSSLNNILDIWKLKVLKTVKSSFKIEPVRPKNPYVCFVSECKKNDASISLKEASSKWND